MKDQISALMDDELDVEQANHLITAAKSGGEMTSCWATYHLIGDVMRGNPVLKTDIQQRIMQSIAEEPSAIQAINVATLKAKQNTENAQHTQKINQPKSISMLWSVAASVAAVTFVSFMVMKQQSGVTQLPSAMAVAKNTTQTEILSPVEIAQNMPSEYLLAHQSAAPNSVAYYIQPAAYSESK